MSSPSKQVGSRRLPPISNGGTLSPYNRSDKLSSSRDRNESASTTRSNGSSSSTAQEGNEKRKYNRNTNHNHHHHHHQDIENAFQQGPFRVPLKDIGFLIQSSPPMKQNKPDHALFLHGKPFYLFSLMRVTSLFL